MGTSEKGKKASNRSNKKVPEKFLELLLDNPTRKEIIRLLETKPGMNKHQISKELGMNVNAVEFHLDRLIEAGQVKIRSENKKREIHCFTADNVDLWENESTRILFGRGPSREVALFVAQNPGASAKQIAEELCISINTARRHIRQLEKAELIQKMRVEQNVFHHAEPGLEEWVERAWGEE